MPYPLPRDEDRHAAMELELDHLARRRVAMAAQVPDEPPRLARPSRPVAVRDARGALDVLVGAHVVDERDEAVIEDREVAAEDLLGGGIGRAARLHGALDYTHGGPTGEKTRPVAIFG